MCLACLAQSQRNIWKGWTSGSTREGLELNGGASWAEDGLPRRRLLKKMSVLNLSLAETRRGNPDAKPFVYIAPRSFFHLRIHVVHLDDFIAELQWKREESNVREGGCRHWRQCSARAEASWRYISAHWIGSLHNRGTPSHPLLGPHTGYTGLVGIWRNKCHPCWDRCSSLRPI